MLLVTVIVIFVSDFAFSDFTVPCEVIAYDAMPFKKKKLPWVHGSPQGGTSGENGLSLEFFFFYFNLV